MKRRSGLVLWIVAVLPLFVTCATPTPRAIAGSIDSGAVASQALAHNLLGDPATRTYSVYLPPSYAASHESYPVVYLLHGYTQTYSSYLAPVTAAMDSLIAGGEAREMIVVFVDAYNRLGGSWYLSSPTIGDYETYIVKELVAEIDSKYRTLPGRSSRAVTGCSMGGYGAMHLALKYPDVFNVAAPMSGSYDFEHPGWEGDASFFSAEPKSWADWVGLHLVVQADMAAAAAAAPNPDTPPFYLDMPFKLVDGKGQIVREVYQKINALDVVHDLERYLNQPTRLKRIMVYHGGSDNPEDARAFDERLSAAGIDHTYVEVEGGGHCTLDWAPILKFMSDELTN